MQGAIQVLSFTFAFTLKSS